MAKIQRENIYVLFLLYCVQSELSGLFNGPYFRYIYMFQAIRRAVNVLNSTCIKISAQCDISQCKYNAQRANIIDIFQRRTFFLMLYLTEIKVKKI